jgi:hypothetical protein
MFEETSLAEKWMETILLHPHIPKNKGIMDV